ncbi:mediator of RNA polymerase II transcription subunit 33A-like isoform X3 [Carex littledalei]|uniref:Mediator of RNA polymerase II transcription subunit 33A-like isoform X3 n=1 Tax=Carex littledalei TaxID=544730 RepID=A0A833VIJ4_9POAL|nr:mediator of RNA polymerase II transcription subunit 33A-like isoform X3 [Carex littledalei]
METEMEKTVSPTNTDQIIAFELKASEVHSKTPLLRSLELSRRLQERGISFPNPNLAEILVSNLCFSQHTPSLWKLLDQAMASRLVDPLQILALLTQKVVPQRKGQPGAYRLYLELLRRYAVTLPPSGTTVPSLDMIVKSIDEALQLSRTYGVTQMDLGHAIVLFIFTLVKTLVDSVLEDCGFSYARTEMQHDNTLLALEIVEKIITNKKAQLLLRLISINMPEEFNNLVERLQLVEVHISKITSPSTINGANNSLATIQKALTYAIHRLEKHPQLGVLFNTRPQNCSFANNFSYGNSTCWIPFDVFMENAMDGRHLHVVSAIEVLTELIKGLQVLNQATWQETFEALWLSGLQHVQRGRDQVEGPIPLVDARLSILLAIVPLSIVPLVNNDLGRRLGLVTSLQVLGQFSALLTPHPAFVTLAYEAATKAAVFISNANPNIKATGNMLHLIVEACIARNLIDTSAYFWPGYVVPSAQLLKEPHLTRDTPWTAFMGGAPLTASLEKALTITAAPSVAELEKLYIIALNGSEEERPMASRILCGASLTRGWNFQEHAVDMVVKLLSPSSSLDSSEIEIENPYISHMRMLNALLLGMNSIDTVHILSLFGLIPEVAAALMPICEAFGSLPPPSNHKSCLPEETSVYSVFSYAFLLLLRLWKFYRPPQEHCIPTRGAQELTLDYLLLLRNGCVSLRDPNAKPVYIEFFPKLRAWYFQNQACISSTLSGLCKKNPVHQVANMILNMVWRGSGLRHIVDFLPASLAVFVTYFSAEMTRGIWKPVHLNGIDWPSPAANLFSVDLEIKEILASAGVDVPCSYPRGSLPMLPLPIAVLVSLTITFKLDKNSDHMQGIIGHALEKCTSSSSWPSMPIVGALWIQKVRRWHNFVVLSCTRSPFSRDKDATAQLIKSCFTCFLGTSSLTDGSHFVEKRGSSGLFGLIQVDRAPRIPVAPGYLYVYSCRNFHDIHYVSEVVLSLILDWARTLADECVKSNHNGMAGRVRSDSGAASLASALSRVRQSVSLGASLLVITGGPKLVQVLYEETFPTLLLLGKADSKSPMHGILSGYAVAYLLFYSGVFVWGVSEAPPVYTWVYSSKRARVFGRHMDFMAKAVEGHLQPNCQPGAWKAFVKCFIGLVVRFTPSWVPDLSLETVTKLARGLNRWNESELALALLEQAGPAAMSAVVEALSWV